MGNTLPGNVCPVSPTAQVAVKEEKRQKKRPWSAFENAAVKSKAERLKCELREIKADPRARGARSWFHPMARRGLGRPKLLSDPQHIPAVMPEGVGLPQSPLLSLVPISTADNEAEHELGDKQKTPKGT